MDKDFNHIPLSQSNVTLKLSEIQKRCSKLIDEPDSLSELTLEEPAVAPDNNNPYDKS